MGYRTILYNNTNNKSGEIDDNVTYSLNNGTTFKAKIPHLRPYFDSRLQYSYYTTGSGSSLKHMMTLTATLINNVPNQGGAFFNYYIKASVKYYKDDNEEYITKTIKKRDNLGISQGTTYGSTSNNSGSITFELKTKSNGSIRPFYVIFYCEGCDTEEDIDNGLNSGHGLYKFIFDGSLLDIEDLECTSKTTNDLTYKGTINGVFKTGKWILQEWDEEGEQGIGTKIIKNFNYNSSSKIYTNTFSSLNPNTKYICKLKIYDNNDVKLDDDEIKNKTLKMFNITSLQIRSSSTKVVIDYNINYNGSIIVYMYNGTTLLKTCNSGNSFSSNSNGTTSGNITLSTTYSPDTLVNLNNIQFKDSKNNIINKSLSIRTKKLNFNSINFSSNCLIYSLSCSAVDAYGNSKTSGIAIKSVIYKISENNNAGSFTATNIYGSVNPIENSISSGSCTSLATIYNLNNTYNNNGVKYKEEYYIYAMIVDTNSGSLLKQDSNNDSVIRIGPIKLDNLLLKFDSSKIDTYTHSIKALIQSYITRNQTSVNYSYLNSTGTNSINISSNDYTNINGITTQYTYNDPITGKAYNFLSDINNYPRAEAIKDITEDKYSNDDMVTGKCGSATINNDHYIIFSNLQYAYCYYDLYANVIDDGGNEAIATTRTNTTFPYTKIYTKLDGESSPSWHDVIPHIYSDGKWKKAIGKVYDGTDWQEQGSGNQAE